MSDMTLDVTWRYKIGEAETLEKAQEIVEPLFGKCDEDDGFYFEKKGNFDVAYIDNEVFLDYYFKDSEYIYDVDVTFGLNEFQRIENDLEEIFSEEQVEYLNEALVSYEDEPRLRVLYYYNGGTSRLREEK